MNKRKPYQEQQVFSFSSLKTIIGILLSILVLVFALLIIMVKTDFTLFGLTIIIPDDYESLALQDHSLIFMKEVKKNSLPPRGELVTFDNEGSEVLVRVIEFEEFDDATIYSVSGGGFIEHKIYFDDLVRQGSFLIPNFGKFVNFMVTPVGLLLCLGFPLITILSLLLMHFIELPKKNGDYTFSNVESSNYFGNATNTPKKSKKKLNKKGFNDPYDYNDQYQQNNPAWPTPNQPQQPQQPYQQQQPQQPQQPQQQSYQQQPPQQQPYQPQQQYQQDMPQYQQTPQPPKSTPNNRPTVESILADVTGHNYDFDDEYEYDDDVYELEYHDEQMAETMPLTYNKPDVVDTDEESNSLIITREFFIAELQPENVTKAHEYTRGVGFQANLNDYEKNNFNIDGIDVNVDSNNIQLAITEDGDSDIFITVTEEFTNVVVNKENLETSFALFKDDEDEKNKVIIRKKQLG